MSQLNDFIICPISHEIMTDPVIDEFGHTYDRKNIESWMLINDTSPLNRKKYIYKTLTKNLLAISFIEQLTNIKCKSSEFEYELQDYVKFSDDKTFVYNKNNFIHLLEFIKSGDLETRKTAAHILYKIINYQRKRCKSNNVSDAKVSISVKAK